jgi:replicative DNA helicase
MFVDRTLELQLLGWQLHNPAKLLTHGQPAVVGMLSEPPQRELSKILWQYFMEYKAAPTDEALHSVLLHTVSDVTKRAELLAMLAEVQAIEAAVPLEQVWKTLDDLRLTRSAFDILSGATEELGKHDGKTVVGNALAKFAILQAQAAGSAVIRRSWQEEVTSRGDRYWDVRANPEKYAGIDWGIGGLDRVTRGLRKSWLCIFFARPGVGKSRLMLNTAYNQARAGYLVQYFSLEMPHDMVEALLDSREALVDYNQILRAELPEEAQEQYRLALQRVRKRDDVLEIVDIPRGCSTPLIEHEMKLFAAKHGRMPDVIYIDHIGLTTAAHKLDKWANLAAVVREFHEMARVYDVAVVSAMHEKRKQHGSSKETGLDDVYGTDEAGQHAELVALIEQDPIDEAKGLLHVTFKKNRYGPINTNVDLLVDWSTTYVGDAVVKLINKPSTDPLGADDVQVQS